MLIFCSIEEEKHKDTCLECPCGNQRYCPQEKKSIFTEGALRCPIRTERNKDKYGDRGNAEGVNYADNYKPIHHKGHR